MVYVIYKTKAVYQKALHDNTRFKAYTTGKDQELKRYKTLNGVLKAFKRLGDPKPLKDIINENNTSGFVYSISTVFEFNDPKGYFDNSIEKSLKNNIYIKA